MENKPNSNCGPLFISFVILLVVFFLVYFMLSIAQPAPVSQLLQGL